MQFENQQEHVIYLRGCLRELLAIAKRFDESIDQGAVPTQAEMREFANRAMSYAAFCAPDQRQQVDYSAQPEQVAPPQQPPQQGGVPLRPGCRYLENGTIIDDATGMIYHPETGQVIGVADSTQRGVNVDPRQVSAAPGGIPNTQQVQQPGPFHGPNPNMTSTGVARVDQIPQADGW